VTADTDENAVRAYLRAVIGAPLRASAGNPAKGEAAFVGAAQRWAKQAGVDRRTLARIGVTRRVLDAAGVAAVSAEARIRRLYTREPFTVAQLAKRAGVTEASVRRVLAIHEETGEIVRAGRVGRALQYRKTRR
jgi:hypothetical protein